VESEHSARCLRHCDFASRVLGGDVSRDAMADHADLMGIGAHCSHPECGQVDFLPFKCDCCSRVFCLEHRSYRAHACEKADGNDSQVIICPLCAKSIRLKGHKDVHEAFDAHSRANCDPSNYAKVHHKPRCSAPGCKERLREVNTYRCKTCGKDVCMAHRFESDHACPGESYWPELAVHTL
jgi:predicted nucleic acid binding AN1-type Zn finger protein